MPVRYLLVYVSLLACAPSARAAAQQEPFSEVHGAVTIAGKKVEFKATCGRLPVLDRTGTAKANVFFMAYTRKPEGKSEVRPLTFCFNGGPGASSVWLHLGAFGPHRVLLSDDGKFAVRPTRLVENEWSLLDLTDLVFIDPVSTGYSRSQDPKAAKLFHGVEEDVQSVGEFIRHYVARFERGASPTFLAGESYGTTRAVGVAKYLQGRAGVRLVGVLLISAVLDFQTVRFDEGNELPYTLFLPSYTASAWHHKKLGKKWAGDLAAVLEEAQQFANGEYAQALRKGNLLGDDERHAVAKKLAMFTGLTEKEVLRADLRVDATRFRRELLKDTGEVIGRYDSRVRALVRDAGKNDPSYAVLLASFTEAINTYLPFGLGYKSALKYQVSNAPVQPWNYGEAGTNKYLSVSSRLRAVMEKDHSLRVFVACGYCDLATPFAATQYTFAHIGPRALTERVTMTYYEAGHMMYTHQPSLRKLRDDIGKFIASARPVAKAGLENNS